MDCEKNEKHIVPSALSDAEKYRRLGIAVTNKQRGLLALIVKMSRNGEWTTYADAEAFGIRTPSKRLSEMLMIDGLGIVKRDKLAKNEKGGACHICEFCVV